jgi:hypothetical protein
VRGEKRRRRSLIEQVNDLSAKLSEERTQKEIAKGEATQLSQRCEKLHEEHRKKAAELQEKLDVLMRGEQGITRIVEWEDLFQVTVTSYIDAPVQLIGGQWIGVFGGPLDKYPLGLDMVIRPEDEQLSYQVHHTRQGDLYKWVRDHSGFVEPRPRTWVLQLANSYQVMVKNFLSEVLDVEVKLTGQSLPTPRELHHRKFPIGPSSPLLTIQDASER